VRKPDGLVRITLERAYSDGTVAVEMDPLSLLCRLATSVPPPRFHTVKDSGVLAPASLWQSLLAPRPKPSEPVHASGEGHASKRAGATYRPWADLLERTFGEDILACPKCNGRMLRAPFRRSLRAASCAPSPPRRSRRSRWSSSPAPSAART
jgi:hypothetical protein